MNNQFGSYQNQAPFAPQTAPYQPAEQPMPEPQSRQMPQFNGQGQMMPPYQPQNTAVPQYTQQSPQYTPRYAQPQNGAVPQYAPQTAYNTPQRNDFAPYAPGPQYRNEGWYQPQEQFKAPQQPYQPFDPYVAQQPSREPFYSGGYHESYNPPRISYSEPQYQGGVPYGGYPQEPPRYAPHQPVQQAPGFGYPEVPQYIPHSQTQYDNQPRPPFRPDYGPMGAGFEGYSPNYGAGNAERQPVPPEMNNAGPLAEKQPVSKDAEERDLLDSVIDEISKQLHQEDAEKPLQSNDDFLNTIFADDPFAGAKEPEKTVEDSNGENPEAESGQSFENDGNEPLPLSDCSEAGEELPEFVPLNTIEAVFGDADITYTDYLSPAEDEINQQPDAQAEKHSDYTAPSIEEVVSRANSKIMVGAGDNIVREETEASAELPEEIKEIIENISGKESSENFQEQFDGFLKDSEVSLTEEPEVPQEQEILYTEDSQKEPVTVDFDIPTEEAEESISLSEESDPVSEPETDVFEDIVEFTDTEAFDDEYRENALDAIIPEEPELIDIIEEECQSVDEIPELCAISSESTEDEAGGEDSLESTDEVPDMETRPDESPESYCQDDNQDNLKESFSTEESALLEEEPAAEEEPSEKDEPEGIYFPGKATDEGEESLLKWDITKEDDSDELYNMDIDELIRRTYSMGVEEQAEAEENHPLTEVDPKAAAKDYLRRKEQLAAAERAWLAGEGEDPRKTEMTETLSDSDSDITLDNAEKTLAEETGDSVTGEGSDQEEFSTLNVEDISHESPENSWRHFSGEFFVDHEYSPSVVEANEEKVRSGIDDLLKISRGEQQASEPSVTENSKSSDSDEIINQVIETSEEKALPDETEDIQGDLFAPDTPPDDYGEFYLKTSPRPTAKGYAVEAEKLSCNIFYRDARNNSRQVLNNASFKVPTGSICGFVSERAYDSYTLLSVISGCRGYDSGKLSVCGVDVAPREMVEIPGILYVDGAEMFNPDLTVEQIVSASRSLSGNDDMLDYIKRCGLGGRLMFDVHSFTLSQCVALYIIASLPMGIVDTVVINIPELSFRGKNSAALAEACRIVRDMGKTVMIASISSDYVDEIADTVVVISNGEAVYSGDVADFRCAASETVLAARCDNPQEVKEAVEGLIPELQVETGSDGFIIHNNRTVFPAEELEKLLRQLEVPYNGIIKRPLSFSAAAKETGVL